MEILGKNNRGRLKMAESELAKKVTTLVKAGDKLVQDLKKGVGKLIEAARELKKDEEEKSE